MVENDYWPKVENVDTFVPVYLVWSFDIDNEIWDIDGIYSFEDRAKCRAEELVMEANGWEPIIEQKNLR